MEKQYRPLPAFALFVSCLLLGLSLTRSVKVSGDARQAGPGGAISSALQVIAGHGGQRLTGEALNPETPSVGTGAGTVVAAGSPSPWNPASNLTKGQVQAKPLPADHSTSVATTQADSNNAARPAPVPTRAAGAPSRLTQPLRCHRWARSVRWLWPHRHRSWQHWACATSARKIASALPHRP